MHFIKAKGILSQNNGMNIYRGCTHGCIYCDSRSDCYQMNHDLEDIEVKENAAQLLEVALRSKRNKCMIGTGAMCDPYMHCEKNFGLMRKCLEIIDKYEFGVTLQTKSDLVLRDLDLLKRINEHSKCVVQMTLTTYDEKLCRVIEPNVCTTKRRYETLKELEGAGIPTVVWFTPMLPYINDTEQNVRGILEYCFDANVKGILTFGGGGMTLRPGDREHYYEALDRHFPGLKERYIREYGLNYEVPSPNGKYLLDIIKKECIKHKVMYKQDEIFAYLSHLPKKFEQVSMF